ncbi:hypothetical protein ACP70R_015896 [Stipagrostis hirtigluma subsp. patula]
MMLPAAAPDVVEEQPGDSSEYKFRKQLLLLAMLVVSVTYVAGLSPPGGVWQEDGGGMTAGSPILRSTHHARYLAFFYCNATALVASLVVIFLLLLKNPTWAQLTVLRLVMALDMLALMGAFLAGNCHERPATVYAAALVLALSAYVGVHILQALSHARREERGGQEEPHPGVLKPKERRKVLLLLATFAAALTYVAGLNPPGGFWDSPSRRRPGAHPYRPGESLVEAHHRGHYRMFVYCNSTAFVASLFIIVLLLHKRLGARSARSFALHVFVLGALVGLVAAYDAGSCRDADCSVYVVSLFGAVLAFIFVAMVVILLLVRGCGAYPPSSTDPVPAADSAPVAGEQSDQLAVPNGHEGRVNIARVNSIDRSTKKLKSLVLLLANLVATVTYQAGLDPPGGFWPDDGEGHRAGDAILLSKEPLRYKVFFYCNSTAFVVSLIAILMVQSVNLVKSHTLLVAMMLDMFALIAAYAAGSCRTLRASINVVAMAGAVLLCVLIHVLFFTLCPSEPDERTVEKKHKRLLLLAILLATITYQVGLTPPGGFWIDDAQQLRHGHRAGDAVLLHNHPRHFRAFFYCNTASFMASMALILLLVNPNLSRLAIRCYALYACQVAGLVGLMGAYAAGSARSLRTSIFVFALVGAVIAFIFVHVVMFEMWERGTSSPAEAQARDGEAAGEAAPERDASETMYRDVVYAKRKYLMLLGILAASVTYQAGLAPPGGLWQDDGDGGRRREAGSPVLHDTDARRYHVFFYSNSTSFVASAVVIALLLQQILRKHQDRNNDLLLLATNTAVVLDLLGLLAAYAAGSTRDWAHIVALPVLVVLFMAVHAAVWLRGKDRHCGGGGVDVGGENSNGRQPPIDEHAHNGHGQPSQGGEIEA